MKPIIYLILVCVIMVWFSKNQCLSKVSKVDKVSNIDTFINAGKANESKPMLDLDSGVLNNALNASNMYDDEYWTIKPTGFSDIYNYEDSGGTMINNMATIDRTTNITFKEIPLVEPKLDKSKDSSNETIPLKLLHSNEVYNLVGLAINEYYNQYYLLYESQPAPNSNITLGENLSYLNYHINSYLLAKMHDAKPVVLHNIGPRAKINISDVVYLSEGPFQLGPLVIKSIKLLQK